MKTIPIFIINLPKDKYRKEFMANQMHDLRLQYEFVEGKLGTDPEVVSSCDNTLAIKEHGKVLTTGEKGCAFSHRSIYERMLRENIPKALILEDDAVLPKNISQILDKELSRKNINWEWLSFDYPKIGFPFIYAWIKASKYMVKKNPLFFFYALIKFPFIVVLSIFELVRDNVATLIPSFSGPKLFYRPLYNAGAYIVTIEGINKMMPLLIPLRFSADRTPNKARLLANLKMRWYVPRVAHQAEEDFNNLFISNTIN